MVYNYSMMLPFERHFDFKPSTVWMLQHWTWSIWLSGAYLVLIFGGQRVMQNRQPYQLRHLLTAWNALLALFSIMGAVRYTPDFFDTLINRGFVHSVCVMDFKHNVVGFWTQLFGFSKAVELIDTAFIVLRKRPLIFLHWYHHITVLIYTWHAYKDHTAVGRWFVYMNYVVHAFMYSYYTLRSLGFASLPKWVPMSLTTMQIAQMIMGSALVGAVYRIKTQPDAPPCRQTFENLYFSFLIYLTYFALFAHLFYTTYFRTDKYRCADRKKPPLTHNGVQSDKNGAVPKMQNGSATTNGHAGKYGKED